MKIYITLVALFAIAQTALAEVKPKISSQCLREYVEATTAPGSNKASFIKAAIDQAILRAKQITNEKGVSPRYVETRLTQDNGASESLFGLNVRVSDSRDRGQANAYEFVFKIQKSGEEHKVSLLTVEDDWHTHGDYEVEFVCEN